MEEALAIILNEFDTSTITGCIKILGELISNSETITTKIVSQMPNLKLMKSLQLVLVHCDSQVKKLTLWLLSNVCINSVNDALAVI